MGLWDFNEAGLAVGVAAGRLRGCAVPLRCGWYCGLRVSAWCVGGWQGLEAVKKTSYGDACGKTQELDDRDGEATVHGKAVLGAGSGAVDGTRRLQHRDQRVAQILSRDALHHDHGAGAEGTWQLADFSSGRLSASFCAEERAATLERSSAAAVGEEAEVANADQSFG